MNWWVAILNANHRYLPAPRHNNQFPATRFNRIRFLPRRWGHVSLPLQQRTNGIARLDPSHWGSILVLLFKIIAKTPQQLFVRPLRWFVVEWCWLWVGVNNSRHQSNSQFIIFNHKQFSRVNVCTCVMLYCTYSGSQQLTKRKAVFSVV